jgi:hypothetical protein
MRLRTCENGYLRSAMPARRKKQHTPARQQSRQASEARALNHGGAHTPWSMQTQASQANTSPAKAKQLTRGTHALAQHAPGRFGEVGVDPRACQARQLRARAAERVPERAALWEVESGEFGLVVVVVVVGCFVGVVVVVVVVVVRREIDTLGD